MEVNTLILLGNDIFPGNPRKPSRSPDVFDRSCLEFGNPGLSYSTHDEIETSSTCNITWAFTLEDLKKLIESQTTEQTYTLNFGWHLFPYMDYNSGDQLKTIINLLKGFKNFNLLKWRFANGWDLYNVAEEKRIAWFKTQIHDIIPKNIMFHLVNVATCNTYKEHFPGVTVEPYFIYYQRMLIKNLEHEFTANKGKRERYFICLNNYKKEHRTSIVDWIKFNKWQSSVDFSYISENRTLGVQGNKKTVKDEISLWQDSPPYEYFNRCYFYIATETHFYQERTAHVVKEEHTSVPTFISEKTLKALHFEIPLIVVGLPYSLRALRDLGYKTFPELFDESYDEELDDNKRMSLIKDTVQNLMNKSLDELHDIVMQDSVQAKLLHNKQLFLNKFTTSPWRQWEPFKHSPW